jgi:secernin
MISSPALERTMLCRPGSAAEARPWSCDTFTVSAAHSRYGATLLGKNSDRPARETQVLRHLPARRGGGRLRLAYVEIDDAPETIAHIGSSPYWCWGHEIGVNVHGVAIGNEAIFTRDVAAAAAADREGRAVQPGILGMELLRLGLERGRSAAEAVEVITDLVGRYGQYGAGTVSKDRPGAAYDNSFIVADVTESWVVETTGRRWAARRVREPYWALSNEPTLRTDWDRASSDLFQHADEQGWRIGDPLDFAATFVDPAVPLQVSHLRLQRARQMLAEAVDQGGVGFNEARAVLSDHYEGTFLEGPKFNPARPDFHTLCMHEHPAGFTWGNTAASLIAVLPADGRPHFWWGATTPCTSLYIPVAATETALPSVLGTAGAAAGTGPNPEDAVVDTPTGESFWWSFQTLLETVAADGNGTGYRDRQPVVRARFDQMQQMWLKQVEELGANATDEEWRALTEHCVAEAHATADELARTLQSPA